MWSIEPLSAVTLWTQMFDRTEVLHWCCKQNNVINSPVTSWCPEFWSFTLHSCLTHSSCSWLLLSVYYWFFQKYTTGCHMRSSLMFINLLEVTFKILKYVTTVFKGVVHHMIWTSLQGLCFRCLDATQQQKRPKTNTKKLKMAAKRRRVTTKRQNNSREKLTKHKQRQNYHTKQQVTSDDQKVALNKRNTKRVMHNHHDTKQTERRRTTTKWCSLCSCGSFCCGECLWGSPVLCEGPRTGRVVCCVLWSLLSHICDTELCKYDLTWSSPPQWWITLLFFSWTVKSATGGFLRRHGNT